MKKIIVLIFLSHAVKVMAQDSISKTLSAANLIEIVQLYHPIAKQAGINIEKSKAAILFARGMFDPELETNAAQKTFDGIKYYNTIQPRLTIPTWYGIELSAGAGYLAGSRLDPTETTGQSSFVGIVVPVAKNLLMDKRRAALKTAKIFRALSEVEKRTMINELLFDAMSAYWQWVKWYELHAIIAEAVKVNEKRLAFVKAAFKLGERPAIDTTETRAQLQSFLYQQNETLLQYKIATLQLSLFLWQQNEQPWLLQEDVIPAKELLQQNIVTRPIPVLQQLLSTTEINHPKIVEYTYKLSALNINRRLKYQEMLPKLDLKYNHLGKGYNVFKTAAAPLWDNNYQFGFSFSLPLRLSQGRSAFKTARLMIDETRLQQNLARVTITNKVKIIFNELLALKQQVIIQADAYTNYLALQKGEEIRFMNGESSLFLINTRETKTLEAQQKLTELKAKFFETEIKLQWAAGMLQ